MLYLTLKALHLVFVLTWISGMVATALILSLLRPGKGAFLLPETHLLVALRRWNHFVTSPAMVLAWGIGLALASLGHWFPSGWLAMKLVLVLALSALHGILSGTLRRITDRVVRRKPSRAWCYAPFGILLMAGGIVLLVLIKPFQG